MAGKRYGDVTGVRKAGVCASRDIRWEFLCVCGGRFEASGYAVRSGKIKTCPACSRTRSAAASVKHGKTETPEFSTWIDIQTRCHNKKSASYSNYGGRGISVCARWRSSFDSFLEDMGLRPSSVHSIDRIENDGDYEPGNCRWATMQEQANNRRSNVRVEIDGEVKTLAQWADKYSAPHAAVARRYRAGVRGIALFSTTRRQLTHNGITDSVSGWSRRTGLKQSTISMRITHYCWPVSRALSEGALF